MKQFRLLSAAAIEEEVVQGIAENVADDVYRFLVDDDVNVLAVVTVEGDAALRELGLIAGDEPTPQIAGEGDAPIEQLIRDFHDGAQGVRDVDMSATVHAIIADVVDSVRMAEQRVAETGDDSITEIVSDYVTNHYGDL